MLMGKNVKFSLMRILFLPVNGFYIHILVRSAFLVTFSDFFRFFHYTYAYATLRNAFFFLKSFSPLIYSARVARRVKLQCIFIRRSFYIEQPAPAARVSHGAFNEKLTSRIR